VLLLVGNALIVVLHGNGYSVVIAGYVFVCMAVVPVKGIASPENGIVAALEGVGAFRAKMIVGV
jgi:hypothetical protein